jgi:hypothetical protein
VAGQISNADRDTLITLFRERICARLGVTPLVHQRKWWSATDGLILLDDQPDPDGVSVQLQDGSKTKWAVVERERGRAKVVADLGAFKTGKSFGTGLWAAGFGAVPGAKVTLIGAEYSMVEPEFAYLLEFLLAQRGMGMKARKKSANVRTGDFFLELENGMEFDAKSWERKDALKGKEVDAYIFCEAYQFPGIECFTDVRQNLVARDGYAIFPTTPDRPWIKELHDRGHLHSEYPEWECICHIPRRQNPFTYNARIEEQDRSLLTKEKFEIAHHGALGDFVGRVFKYQRGDRVFGPGTHPFLFPASGGSERERFALPPGWILEGGADTGTYYSALLVAFSPEGEAFVIDEFPNYRYLGGTPERNEGLSVPEWASGVVRRVRELSGKSANLWADPNSQFKAELRNYGVTLLPAKIPVETRTEITREYFEHGRIWLAPWLTALPFELENASWPEEASATGKFARVKDRDHTLDPLEHILARRPFGRSIRSERHGSWAAASGMKRKEQGSGGNIHLGRF